jgi:hypothetical protein
MDFKAIELEMTRALIFWLCLYSLITALGVWSAYILLKLAIKNGINESVLGERRGPWAPSAPTAPKPIDLPEMRADK